MTIINDSPESLDRYGWSPWIKYEGGGNPLDDHTPVRVRLKKESWREVVQWFHYPIHSNQISWSHPTNPVNYFSFKLANEEN